MNIEKNLKPGLNNETFIMRVSGNPTIGDIFRTDSDKQKIVLTEYLEKDYFEFVLASTDEKEYLDLTDFKKGVYLKKYYGTNPTLKEMGEKLDDIQNREKIYIILDV